MYIEWIIIKAHQLTQYHDTPYLDKPITIIKHALIHDFLLIISLAILVCKYANLFLVCHHWVTQFIILILWRLMHLSVDLL